MARRLPPLNALRAFEAAARHLSFTKAAEELNVTQAAISHQVKALEEHIGAPLFRRLNRALALTEPGRVYLPLLSEAFDLIDAGTRRVRARDLSGPLRISVLPSFAGVWLLPRLRRFREQHPDIDVLVQADDRLVDFAHEDIDLGVRYGFGNYPGLRCDYLMGDEIFPVCAPGLVEGDPPLRRPEDLRHHTLVHDEVSRTDDSPDWRIWLRAAGLEDSGIDPDRGPGYSDMWMVLTAAAAGEGVALGRKTLAADFLKDGRLTAPFGPRLKTRLAYWVVSARPADEWPKVRAFREWLLAEAQAEETRPDLLQPPEAQGATPEEPAARPE
ncbi:MAG: transcriptional regulator GcvA [Tistlia sp.]|uniref:transcriptional regulator GcvA n=1 Tax=Tistlia sp. TaxID=3057121 RepID=UPI0034A5257C